MTDDAKPKTLKNFDNDQPVTIKATKIPKAPKGATVKALKTLAKGNW
jgi:hypothetical protein